MTPNTRKAILWGAVALVGLLTLARWDAVFNDRADRELDALVAGQVASGKAFRAALAKQAADSVRFNAMLLQERRRRLQEGRAADSAHSVADSLAGALAASRTVQDSVLALLGERVALRGEVASLRAVQLSMSAEVDSVLVDRDRWKALAVSSGIVIDSLTAALVTVNQARQCRILLLPCPSRATVGVVGLLTGAVVGVVVSR